MNALTWIAVGLLGGLGALARVHVDRTVLARLGRRSAARRDDAATLAGGILVVNLSGAFALGVLDGVGLGHDASVLVATALVGAYTTFSTWMLHTRILWRRGDRRGACLNLGVSLVLGFALLTAGRALAVAL